MKHLKYSELRDRLILSSTVTVPQGGGERLPSTHRLRLVARIKPSVRLLGHIRRPWRFLRVEHYHPEGTDGSSDIAVKYALGVNPRIESEVRALEHLKESGASEGTGLLFPEIVKVVGVWASGTALVSPWKPRGTVADIVREGTTDPVKLAQLLKQCSRALRRLHDIPVASTVARTLPPFRHLGPVGGALEGDPAAAALVEPVLRNIPVDRVVSNLQSSASWVHGDCFAYQFVLDGDGAPWLLDWEGARVSWSGLSDLAQLWTSFELAVLLNADLASHIATFWHAFQEGYGRDLDADPYFRVLELRALVRFSPRMPKFGVVVPTCVASPGREISASSGVLSNRVRSTYELLVKRRMQELETLAS